MKQNPQKITFKDKISSSEKKKNNWEVQPPKKKILIKVDINRIFEYSAIKNKAKPVDEYSTLYPETNSASASGRSNGARFVSASAEIKKMTNVGNSGIQYQIVDCFKMIVSKSKDSLHKMIVINNNPNEISYEIICAVERNAPKNEYFELLDQPEKIIP